MIQTHKSEGICSHTSRCRSSCRWFLWGTCAFTSGGLELDTPGDSSGSPGASVTVCCQSFALLPASGGSSRGGATGTKTEESAVSKTIVSKVCARVVQDPRESPVVLACGIATAAAAGCTTNQKHPEHFSVKVVEAGGLPVGLPDDCCCT